MLCCLLAAQTYALEATELDGTDDILSFKGAIPDVSHLNQIQRDFPSSVTVIESDLIRSLGLMDTREIMRLVPGMRVGQGTDREHFIQYHGTNGIKHRMGISLDGHTYTQSVLNQTIWNLINPKDIKRFTISRSPGGATFGDQNYVGQVNMETFNPEDRFGTGIQATAGSLNTRVSDIYSSGKLTDNVAISVNGSMYETDGFDYAEDQRSTRYDYTDARRLNLKLNTDIDDYQSISLYVGNIDLENGASIASSGNSEPIGNDPNDPINVEKHDVFFDYKDYSNNKLFKVSVGFQKYISEQTAGACNPAFLYAPTLRTLSEINSNLAVATISGQPIDLGQLTPEELAAYNDYQAELSNLGPEAYQDICTESYQAFTNDRYNLDLSYEWFAYENLRLVVGAAAYTEHYESDVYFNGKVNNYSASIFTQGEYRQDKYTINFGGTVEDGRYLDKPSTAIRGSFNYHFNEQNTLRFGVSQGFRTPDVIETRRDWGYYGLKALSPNPWNAETVDWFFRNNDQGELEEERITSYEISYLYNSASLLVDAKIFQDEYKQLIDDNVTFMQPPISGGGTNTLKGFETGITYKLSSVDFGFVYSYIDDDPSIETEEMLSATHQGVAYVIGYLPYNQTLAYAFYGNSPMNNEKYGRSDIVYTYDKYFTTNSSLFFQLRLSYFHNDAASVKSSDLDVNVSYLEDQEQGYLTLGVTF